jgi:hypothetical protein
MDYHILIPLIPFVLGIILKTILDFNLAYFVVKRCYWLPVRWLFRTKPEVISDSGHNYGKMECQINIKIKQVDKAH